MSTENAQLDDVLRHAQHMQSAMDEQLHQLNTRSFQGRDEAKTVAATVDGRQRLTDLHIQDGLLRLGPQVVAQRVNEAMANAQAAVTAADEAEQQRFFELMDDAAGSLKGILGFA
ncbi:Nucleoid-associated protein YbaB [Mycobacterium lentiflavum]|uniref:Nucleoid-associated protein YbaB n=1 Tax=Mycobacterium lentiflavum TaxID=141349 RepID=A0A0E4GW02_MYCLN|nr:YbaB/EbfC family nucleoid-associated protein [Mycobacterium lentiflavum]CQD07714.1 Nucleoid-associated protein YbaB [Mycobacterium lentiflavum]